MTFVKYTADNKDELLDIAKLELMKTYNRCRNTENIMRYLRNASNNQLKKWFRKERIIK